MIPQLLCHLWGDYLLQSDWMAQNKTKNNFPAIVHAFLYSSLFLLLQPSVAAWAVIVVSHFLIDRFRLVRYLIWAKNQIGPHVPWSQCKATGYADSTPAWLAVWLMIVADNTLHLTINLLALKYL